MEREMVLRTTHDLGIALQRSRMNAGFSQQEVADFLGVPQSTVSQMESGMSTIYVRRLLAIMRSLDVTLIASWRLQDRSAAFQARVHPLRRLRDNDGSECENDIDSESMSIDNSDISADPTTEN